MLFNVKEKVPARGYKLEKWATHMDYRATAVAYMKAEGLYSVEHQSGRWYSLEQLEKAMIGNH